MPCSTTSPAVATAFEAALGRLAARGARIERLNLPAFDALAEPHPAPWRARRTAEAHALHIERLTGPAAEEIDQRVVARPGSAPISPCPTIAPSSRRAAG